MKVMRLPRAAAAANAPVALQEIPTPEPGPHQVRLKIHACVLCHTDLHIVEGDLELPRLPTIPGYEIVGIVDAVGQQHPSGCC